MRKVFGGKYTDFKKEHEIEIIQAGSTCAVLIECGDNFSVLKVNSDRAQSMIRELKLWNKVSDWCVKNEWHRPDEVQVHLDFEHGHMLAGKLKQLLGRMQAEATRRENKDEAKKIERLIKWVEANG